MQIGYKTEGRGQRCAQSCYAQMSTHKAVVEGRSWWLGTLTAVVKADHYVEGLLTKNTLELKTITKEQVNP
jgi:hypothetical protein